MFRPHFEQKRRQTPLVWRQVKSGHFTVSDSPHEAQCLSPGSFSVSQRGQRRRKATSDRPSWDSLTVVPQYWQTAPSRAMPAPHCGHWRAKELTSRP